ncbi:MAG: DUF1549 and DUF1553 domain-containing protein [Verrucomicrobiota bacterium]
MIPRPPHLRWMIPCLVIIAGIGMGFAADRTKKVETPWSFAPLQQKDELPVVSDDSWPKTRIDYFVLAKMEAKGLKPTKRADGRILLRRLHFDLTGLPPTPAEVADFCDCASEGKIDELLTSPHYGERWGRHWLDLVRYTDTTSSWLKSTGSAWLYRDWVVRSFNQDLSYPDFIKRQLAADQMPEVGPEENAALGFLGLSPTYWKELQLPPEIIKATVADEWEERIDTLGRTFLGLTVACARCHDHKANPISTADYYALAGVFASIKMSDRPMMAEELWLPVKKARGEVAVLVKKQADLKKKKPKPEDLKEQLAELSKRIKVIKTGTPHYNMATIVGVKDSALHVLPKKKGHGTLLDYQDGKARDLEIQIRGNPNDTGEVVPRRFLSAFPAQKGEPRQFKNGSGRLELGESLVKDSKPLLARVIVNRIWRQHFGRGLVETPSDFGNTGARPSHPELLDDLAARFVDNGWSFKWLHREILNSATWQQSSFASDSAAADPGNIYYSRMSRQRLDVEAWRDAMLSVSAVLNEELGGKPVDLNDAANVRRTLYGKIHRRDLNKMLQVHDFPDPAAHSPARANTITPLQMLFALNGPLLKKQATEFAKRIESDKGVTNSERITRTYDLMFQREPNKTEVELAEVFLETASLAEYARVLFAGNEFLYID